MADGLCTEDTVGNLIEKTLVKDYTNIVKCVHTSSVNDVSCENVKSFYIDSDSGKLCGKLCGVKGSDAKHEGFLDVPCSPGDDECRKKRCADRYDSSESSDSGVAVLSCTDCSTYSGGSTASSDITDPGSPFSTASSHSEDSSTAPHVHQPPKMAPNLTAHHPPWPWSGSGGGGGTTTTSTSPPLKRLNAAVGCTATDQHSHKRLRTDASDANATTCNHHSAAVPAIDATATATVTATAKRLPTTKSLTEAAAAVSYVVGGKIQQGKITEYFKAQMKSAARVEAKGVHKYFTLVDGPKVILGGRCSKFAPDIYQKLDVRTLTVARATPVKKVMLDTKTRKISHLLSSVPRKILPAPRKTNGAQQLIATPVKPTVKVSAMRYQHQNVTYVAAKPAKPRDCAAFKLQKILPVTNLNLTVSSTVVPIATLSNLSLVNHNLNSLSVETAVPTVPTAKAKQTTNCKPSPKVLSPGQQQQQQQQQKKNTMTDTSSGNSCSSSISSTNSEVTTGAADSDSGVSMRGLLTVSVAPVPCESEPQKSPILSQPKTIRFPAKQTQSGQKEQRRPDPNDSGLCRWTDCQAQFDTSGALLEHLQIKHVISQATQEHYVCFWVGCKVQGRPSCSRSWLERHVLGHAGNKPFRCIVDGCGCRFSSQQALEKHVNSHFNASESNSNGSTRKSLESGSTKLFKRNGKKLRYRRQPWSARMFDFFDAGIMEGLQHRLVTMTELRTNGGDACNKAAGDAVTLHARILARRIEPDGTRKVLINWNPPDLVPDEWVLESESKKTRTVSIPTLQPSALDALRTTLFPPQSQGQDISAAGQLLHHPQKQRRKRVARSS